jgi:hypothetical protein
MLCVCERRNTGSGLGLGTDWYDGGQRGRCDPCAILGEESVYYSQSGDMGNRVMSGDRYRADDYKNRRAPIFTFHCDSVSQVIHLLCLPLAGFF